MELQQAPADDEFDVSAIPVSRRHRRGCAFRAMGRIDPDAELDCVDLTQVIFRARLSFYRRTII